MGANLKEGYLDDIVHILDGHRHPCIVIGRFALRWMGCGVFSEEPLDLLVRNDEIAEIISELKKAPHWEEFPLDKKYMEDHLQPSPRIFKRSDDSFSIKLWTESATHLVVDAGGGNDHVEVMDCKALNTVLVEESMHPDPDTEIHYPDLLTTPNKRFLPHVLCQSFMRRPPTKIYIPTVARYIAALLAQAKWLHNNNYDSIVGYGSPTSDIGLLVRYLFLEIPSQRRKLLPRLDNDERTQLEQILDSYKRTRKLKVA